MKKDYQHHVKVCVQCQKHAHLQKQPSQELHSIISPWPFATWGIDFIGMIHHYSKDGHRFIITTIECTIKWVETIPMKSYTQEKVISFLTEYIITRFGMSQWLIMVNG